MSAAYWLGSGVSWVVSHAENASSMIGITHTWQRSVLEVSPWMLHAISMFDMISDTPTLQSSP